MTSRDAQFPFPTRFSFFYRENLPVPNSQRPSSLATYGRRMDSGEYPNNVFYSGIDFNLPGNGGSDCAYYIVIMHIILILYLYLILIINNFLE